MTLCKFIAAPYMGRMNAPPDLTDRPALLRNRRRAQPDALFLHRQVADELHDRLQEVNRSFTDVTVVTGHGDFWRAAFPDARVIADDDVLDLATGSCDLLIHAMALHWANDPVGQLVQCRHALRPDGLFLGAAFGGQTLHQLRSALAEAETRRTGGLSPRIAPMGEIRDLGALLQRAGFALPVADGMTQTVSYRDALHLMGELRAMGEGNALAARLRRPTRRGVMLDAARTYADHFGTPDGRIPATFEIITLTGWAPADSQPQPLRPGSARTRLAEALGTVETPLDRSSD